MTSSKPGTVGREARRSGAAPRLHARAYDILARHIADGSIAAGTPLLESRIAEQFGISRAPARHALAKLESDGLIGRREGRGYVVLPSAPSAEKAGPLSGFAPEPLSSAASWERIYAEIETAIVARTSFATWRVVESELARHYGVSRAVAREVIARLHQRGIVKKDGRSRWYAPGLTPAYVGELYELRWVLEPAALLNAAPRIPDGLLAAMRRNLETALDRAAELDGAALDALEAELHVRLLGHCGNATMMEALSLYQSLLIAHHFLYAWAPRLYPSEPFLPEHLEVVAPLERGDVAAAAKALEAHLRVSRDRAIHRIEVVARDYQPDPLPYLEPMPDGALRPR